MGKNCIIKDGYAIVNGHYYFEAIGYYYASEEVRIFLATIMSLYKENAEKKFFFEFELREFFEVVKNVIPQTTKTFDQIFEELKVTSFIKSSTDRESKHNKWYLSDVFYGEYDFSDKAYDVLSLSKEISSIKDSFFETYSNDEINVESDENEMNFKSIRRETEERERRSYDLSNVF